MINQKLGGEPKIDKIPSVDRYKNFVKPVLEVRGYRKQRGNSHIMINDDKEVIIVPKSCTSDLKHPKELKTITSNLSRKYKGYSIYLLLHRPKNEWFDKPTYMSCLHQVMKNKKFKGIIVGIEEFMISIKDIESKNLLYKI